MANKPILLLIENDISLRRLLSSIFEEPYSLITTTNIFEAWNYLQAGQIPTVILADIPLNEEENKEFVRGLGLSSFYKKISIVILGSESKDVSSSNICKIIPKPFDPDELKETIKNIVFIH